MKEAILGRTNRMLPSLWLNLQLGSVIDPAELVSAAVNTGLPLDVSCSPAVFGSLLADSRETILVQTSLTDFENAPDAKIAGDLLQAHLVQTLSCLGRSSIDFYFLKMRRTLEENQMAGIFEALESARQDGLVKHLGLYVDNFGAALGSWQFHDAFEVISVAESMEAKSKEALIKMALRRRAGVVIRTSSMMSIAAPGQTQLVSVSTPIAITSILEAA